MSKKNVLVTGAAGFIGFHLCLELLKKGYKVVGIDNINGYYDINLKMARLSILGVENLFEGKKTVSTIYGDNFHFFKINLENQILLPKIFESYTFDIVCNLAAQAGVRYSIEEPMVYADSNITGFLNILECVRHFKIKKLIYASSSSVYGNSSSVPFSTSENVDKPISLYAATKKANELMAHTYSYLFDFQTIGLRFFTVYGPWGRPDMAMFLFTDAILNNKPIEVFNEGNLSRDFTYIDDIIQGVILILENETIKEKYQLYNIGNNKPVKLLDFIEEIEKATNTKAIKNMMPMQPGDVNATWADVDDLKEKFGYNPKVSMKEGVTNFINWYKSYYKINEI